MRSLTTHAVIAGNTTMTAMTGTSTLARKLPATTARIVFTLVFCVQPFTGTHRLRSGPSVFQGF
jgi:hypothetical protein